MNHLNEVASAVGAAMKVPFFSGSSFRSTARSVINVTNTGSQSGEDRIKMLNDSGFATNHHAIAAIQTPNPTASANIDIMDAFYSEFFSSTNIVDIVRVSTIDKDIATR